MNQNNINALAETLSSLDIKSRIIILKKILKDVSKEEVEELYHFICNKHLPYSSIQNWMESRLEGDLSLTPMRVASEVRHQKRIDSRMMPYLIKTAQRIKNRIRMRVNRGVKETSGNCSEVIK